MIGKCDRRDSHGALCVRWHLACSAVAEDAGKLCTHAWFRGRCILSGGSGPVGSQRKPHGGLTATPSAHPHGNPKFNSTPATLADDSDALRDSPP